MIKNSCILKVNKKNLISNYKFFKNLRKNLIIAPTIKANAYGLGDKEILELLKKNGCKNFFVATLEEGIKLNSKDKNINIFVLNGIQNYSLSLFTDNNLIPIINTTLELRKILRNNIRFGIHIDTGINRLGIDFKTLPQSIFKNNKIIIAMSHLSSADEKKNNYNNKQKNNFIKVVNKFSNKNNILFSLSNSNGAILSKSYLFDLIRPGIGLYGGDNKNYFLRKNLKPVVTLSGKIIQIKSIDKNEYIGYNQTFKSKNKIKVAIIGAGYADGIPRSLSNKGIVFYKENKFKIIGRISMDSFTINISNSKHNLKVGTLIDIINNKHGIEYFADRCNTISNEVITSIGPRVKRIYA